MSLPEKRITDFIHKHHIFTLATSANNIPYTCTCFYVYIDELNMFVFTSDHGTRHVDELLEQPLVSGAIALETTMIGKIQGIQFTGLSAELEGNLYDIALSAYLKKFPIARLMPTLNLWCLELDYIKMTDNRLGFGKKLTWNGKSPETQTG